MTPEDITKAKAVLGKTLCFMQWHEDDAKKHGQEIMSTEDMKFLLSLDGITKDDVLDCFDINSGSLSKLQLLKAIQKAKNENKQGIIFGSVLGERNQSAVDKRGYFVSMNGHGSVMWDEVYLSEEAYIKSQISHYKNLLGSFASVAPLI